MRQNGLSLAISLLFLPLLLGILWFNVQATLAVVRQFQSASYPHVEGTIVLSEVRTTRSTKGSPRSTFKVRYAYEVAGQKYEGTRVRYVSDGSTDFSSVDRMAGRYRMKSSVPVYYRPEDPADSLLEVGGNGADVLSPMYPGLFMLALLFCWRMAALAGRDPLAIPEFEREGRTHLTMHVLPPSIFGFFGAGVVLLIGSGWSFSGSPSIPTAIGVWVAVFVAAAAVALFRWARLRSGTFDVILDERTRQLSLPATHGRRRRIEVPLNHIVTVSLERQGKQKLSYRPTLEIAAPMSGSRLEPIGPWLSNQTRAQALADALKIRLRISDRRAKAGVAAP